jgi:cytochrome c
VRFHCAHCHAIDKVSESPLASAPAFRNLRLKYAVADLQRPLLQAELVHPRLDLKADQVEDVMAYFKSLEQ